MSSSAVASVIVRTKNSATTLPRLFESLAAQTARVEIVVVDSGSTDETLRLVRDRADVVVEIPPEEFTYGRALNVGAAAASAPVHAAVSSHCVLPTPDWIARAAAHIAGGAVAAVGLETDGDGQPLTAAFAADHHYLRRHWWWGFSNHASAWSPSAWRAHPFDETLPASEDREWSWRATASGGTLIGDPALVVPIDHRRAGGARAYFSRIRNEVRAHRILGVLPPYGLSDAVREWSHDDVPGPFVTDSRPFGRTRSIEVAARWVGGRGR